jgi:transcriptional regulator with XRE-family HTH domain
MNPLHTLRKARGLTGSALARRARVPMQTIYTWEQRPASAWSALSRIADVLGVTADALLGRTALPTVAKDAVTAADLELLAAMERSFDHYFDSPTLRREPRAWRRLAHMAFCGDLCMLRQEGRLPTGKRELPTLGPHVEDTLKAPPGWYEGWESPRQRQRALPAGR